MSSLKTEGVVKDERAVLNTTIKKEVFDEFKAKCKRTGVPMNTLLEVFMDQYNNGEFKIKFTKGNDISLDLD